MLNGRFPLKVVGYAEGYRIVRAYFTSRFNFITDLHHDGQGP